MGGRTFLHSSVRWVYPRGTVSRMYRRNYPHGRSSGYGFPDVRHGVAMRPDTAPAHPSHFQPLRQCTRLRNLTLWVLVISHAAPMRLKRVIINSQPAPTSSTTTARWVLTSLRREPRPAHRLTLMAA